MRTAVLLLLAGLAAALLFLASKDWVSAPATSRTEHALTASRGGGIRRLQDSDSFSMSEGIEVLEPMVQYLGALAGKLASGEEFTEADKFALGKAIRDTYFAAIPLVGTAIGGPVGGFVGTLIVGMSESMVSSGEGDVWENMKTFMNKKLLREHLLELEGSIDDEIRELTTFLKFLGDSSGLDHRNKLIRLEEDLDLRYKRMVFRSECINSVQGKRTTTADDNLCKTWRQIGMHEIGYVFAVFHLEVALELASWSEPSAPLSKGQRDYFLDKAKKRSREYVSLLTEAYSKYETKRMSWFKKPRYSCGLNYNWFDKTCMMSDGQDCMYSNQPEICTKDGNVWPTDECHAKPSPGADGACDIISAVCKMSGRINPWENYLMGTHMYYWRMTESQRDKVNHCYNTYKTKSLVDMRKILPKVAAIRRLGDILNAPPQPHAYITVLSIDHISGKVGQYFNFDIAAANAALGAPLQHNTVHHIRNMRTGQAGLARFWTTANGGSKGDGHGRWEPLEDAAPGQWQIGDKIQFVQGYHLAAKGANQCDSGATPQEEECEAAADAMASEWGRTQGRQNLVAGSWGHVPPGCSVQSGGDWAAHYNRRQGKNEGIYSLVCSGQAP